MPLEQSPHRGFDAGKQLSIVLCVVGGFLVLGQLAGEVGEGSGSGWLLIIGAGCVITGLILTLLFLILIRVDRIEQRISGSDDSENVA